MKKFRRLVSVVTLSTLCVVYLAAGILSRAQAENLRPEILNAPNSAPLLFASGGLAALSVFESIISVLGPNFSSQTTDVSEVSAAFTPGDLVVYRVGDGSASLTGIATAVFLDEYTPAGT